MRLLLALSVICGVVLGLLHPKFTINRLSLRTGIFEEISCTSKKHEGGTDTDVDIKMLYGISQIAYLCDAPPNDIVSVLSKQNKRDVRAEQRTLDELGVRFNVIEYKGYIDSSLSPGGNFTRVRVISIRGTKTLRNFLSNADSSLVYDDVLGFKAHKGYTEIASAMEQELIGSGLLKLDELPLVITGHSLGGAVAVLLSMLLARQGYKIYSVVSFGMPKFVDSAGVKALNAIPLIQVEHLLDPICSGGQKVESVASAAIDTADYPLSPILGGLLKPIVTAGKFIYLGSWGNFSILMASYFNWSGALDSSGALLSYSITSLA